MKVTISAYRGTLTRKMCGSSNLRDNSNDLFSSSIPSASLNSMTNLQYQPCMIPNKIDWKIEEFAEAFNSWQVRL